MKRLARLTVVVLGLTFLAPVLTQGMAKAEATVEVLHMGRVLTIPEMALPGHLMHGDTLVCDPTVPPGCDV